MTGIGVPLGLLLLNAYAAVLMLGPVSAGIVLGQMGLRRLQPTRAEKTSWRALAASLAILLISLLFAVPLLGWLAWFVSWLLGIGALLLQFAASARVAGAR